MDRKSLGRFGTLAGLALFAAGCGQDSPSPAAPQDEPAVAKPQLAADGNYIVFFHSRPTFSAGVEVVEDAVGAAGGRVGAELPNLNAVAVQGVKDIAALKAIPGVRSVLPDFETRIIDPFVNGGFETVAGGTPAGTNQSTASRYANFTQWNIRRAQIDRAWIPSRGGVNTKVCVIDSGIDAGHNDMIGKVASSISYVPNADVTDSNFHGTHVAGTITSRGIGTASVAPDAQVMVAKVFAATGGSPSSRIWNGIYWCADNGADIINMSLGINGGLPRTCGDADLNGVDDCVEFTAAYQSVVDYATSRGVVVVASAGNNATLLPNASNIWLPAELNGVLSVGATGPNQNLSPFGANATWQFPDARFDGLASYSNYGVPSSVDVFAPGGNRPVAAWPSAGLILAPCARATQGVGGACASGTVYIFSAGTSMAAPHVAGIAALLRSRFAASPRSTTLRNRIEQCIYRSVDPVAPSSTFSRGRVNAFRAVSIPC